MDKKNIFESVNKVEDDKEVPRNERKFSELMSDAEYSAIEGIRVQQLKDGFTKYVSVEGDELTIAIAEMIQRKCPLSIKREYPFSNKYEVWDVNELTIPAHIKLSGVFKAAP